MTPHEMFFGKPKLLMESFAKDFLFDIVEKRATEIADTIDDLYFGRIDFFFDATSDPDVIEYFAEKGIEI